MALLTLAGELQELPPDLLIRGEHMVRGLAELVHAQVGLFCDLQHYLPDQKWKIAPLLDFGWAGEEERSWNMSFFEGKQLGDPMTERCAGLMDPVTTRSREQLVSDAEWYRSPNVNELRRRARIDHCIYSNYRFSEQGRAMGIALHRPWGDVPFTAREIAIVDVFHRSQRLYSRTSNPMDDLRRLTPRQRQVLNRLQAGDSEKQIASALGISRNTVHVYIKALYLHFGVSSRGELMGLWFRKPSAGIVIEPELPCGTLP